MKTIAKRSKSQTKKNRRIEKKAKRTGFDELAQSLGQSLKDDMKNNKAKEIQKNQENNKNSLFSKMKRKRIEKREKASKVLEKDQQRVQMIMNNEAFNENPLDILLQHVSNVVSSKSK